MASMRTSVKEPVDELMAFISQLLDKLRTWTLHLTMFPTDSTLSDVLCELLSSPFIVSNSPFSRALGRGIAHLPPVLSALLDTQTLPPSLLELAASPPATSMWPSLRPTIIQLTAILPPSHHPALQLLIFVTALAPPTGDLEGFSRGQPDLRSVAWPLLPTFVRKWADQPEVLAYLVPKLVLRPDDPYDVLLVAATAMSDLGCAFAGSLTCGLSDVDLPSLICPVCHAQFGLPTPEGYSAPSVVVPVYLHPDAVDPTATVRIRSVRQWNRFWFLIAERQEPRLRIAFGRALARLLNHSPLTDYRLVDDEDEEQVRGAESIVGEDGGIIGGRADDAAGDMRPALFGQNCFKYLATGLRGLGAVLARVLGLLGTVPGSDGDSGEVEALRRVNQPRLVRHVLDMLDVAPAASTPHLLAVLGTVATQCASAALLGSILKTFLERAVQRNLALRAAALDQLIQLAAARHTTVAGLFDPYVPALSVYLVQCWEVDSGAAANGMQLLGDADPRAFLARTLDSTLPELIALDRPGTLEAVATALERPLPELCLDHALAVLLHLLLLPSRAVPAATRLYLHLVAGGGPTVRLSELIRTCALQLIIGLVEAMGGGSDGDPLLPPPHGPVDTTARRLRAAGALRVVLAKLHARPDLSTPTESDPAATLDDAAHATLDPSLAQLLLGKYFLGILSHVSDLLPGQHPTVSVTRQRAALRGLAELFRLVGPPILQVATHVYSTLRAALARPELRTVALTAWYAYLLAVRKPHVGDHLTHVVATLATAYTHCDPTQRVQIAKCLDYVLLDNGPVVRPRARRICLLPVNESAFAPYNAVLNAARGSLTLVEHLGMLTDLVGDVHHAVTDLALAELDRFLCRHPLDVYQLIIAERIDPCVVRLIAILLQVCARPATAPTTASIAAVCLGQLGAVDPTRLTTLITASTLSEGAVPNTRGSEAGKGCGLAGRYDLRTPSDRFAFVSDLLEFHLVAVFRAAKSPQDQGYAAYATQELLKLAGYTPVTVGSLAAGSTHAAGTTDFTSQAPVGPGDIADRWQRFPSVVRETLATLLDTKYSLRPAAATVPARPVFTHQTNYSAWLRTWVLDLMAAIPTAAVREPFAICRNVVRHDEDHRVAQFLLPYALGLVLAHGGPGATNATREVRTVYQAAVAANEKGSYVQSCAQAIFRAVDLIYAWRHQEGNADTAVPNRPAAALPRAESGSPPLLISYRETLHQALEMYAGALPPNLEAEASLACGADARAVYHFEVVVQSHPVDDGTGPRTRALEGLLRTYDRLGVPDGLEGVATLLPTVAPAEQIMLFEATGLWAAAHACYEQQLQRHGDELDVQAGYLRSLNSLGHLEGMLTHIRGLTAQHPEWEPSLRPAAVEAAWRLGQWGTVGGLLAVETVGSGEAAANVPGRVAEPFALALGRLLLSLRHACQADASADEVHGRFTDLLRDTRVHVVAGLAGTGADAYPRSYPDVLRLHLLWELEAAAELSRTTRDPASYEVGVQQLFAEWDRRLTVVAPEFQDRETVLNLRRVLVEILRERLDGPAWQAARNVMHGECSRLWLVTAKAARKAGHMRTAFGALLNAPRGDAGLVQIERAKWYWETDQHGLAHHELSRAAELPLIVPAEPTTGCGVPAPSGDDVQARTYVVAKAKLLLTKWMAAHNSVNSNAIIERYDQVIHLQPHWDKAHFEAACYYIRYLDLTRQRDLSAPLPANLDALIYLSCRNLCKALTFGTRYIYQALPRLLTLWLDFGDALEAVRQEAGRIPDERTRFLNKINLLVQSLVKRLPTYQFLTAFSQIVSRIGHPHEQVYAILEHIILSVLVVFPGQALWAMAAVARASNPRRATRCAAIFTKVRSDPTAMLQRVHLRELIEEATAVGEALVGLCYHAVPAKATTLSFDKDFRRLVRMAPLRLIVPLQGSLTVTLPSAAQAAPTHQPFPHALPTIRGFQDRIDVLHSLQKPKKITLLGSDGVRYAFLCKPKDDLRKDARTMELNSMVNKFLLKDPEARRRQLHVRTYAVVPLSEDCGLIEWVPHTTGYRHIVMDVYRRRHCVVPVARIRSILDQEPADKGEVFTRQLLPLFPVVFPEWFLARFPDPAVWLASRQRYVHTTAAMSMVGYVLGLGDRHGENILFDETTGDCVHVDFSCLFGKGLTLEKPERVPFRLTHNMVAAMGPLGVEGPFRRTCEVTMNLLRDHRDSLMCVLDTFLHDPLVEWNRTRSSGTSHRGGQTAAAAAAGASEAQRRVAQSTLAGIRRKLEGQSRNSLPMSVKGQVDELIKQATNPDLLFQMYIGWAAYI
ncbi:hypothetical protein IWQ60_005140 [Tieghemiomyces parasiticus]|uniref:non-specific serine/threonine protein kinase n=1 Tax=Tieghemiomyces parasiticus TaxID=78921 RepID=A0A9W8AA57_9FUNG|nr:hypothetical protein IWQ60_005140 [Tieghemiomyces parasiticus]